MDNPIQSYDQSVESLELLETILDSCCLGRSLLTKPEFLIEPNAEVEGAYEIAVVHWVKERTTREPVAIRKGFRVYLPETVMVIVRRLMETIQALLAHEVQECFYFDGRRIFDPHVTVTAK